MFEVLASAGQCTPGCVAGPQLLWRRAMRKFFLICDVVQQGTFEGRCGCCNPNDVNHSELLACAVNVEEGEDVFCGKGAHPLPALQRRALDQHAQQPKLYRFAGICRRSAAQRQLLQLPPGFTTWTSNCPRA